MVGVVKGIQSKNKMSGSNIYKVQLTYWVCLPFSGMESPDELLFQRKICNSPPTKMETTPDLINHHFQLQEASKNSNLIMIFIPTQDWVNIYLVWKFLLKMANHGFLLLSSKKKTNPRFYTIINPNGHERNHKFLKKFSKNVSQQLTLRSSPADHKTDNSSMVPDNPTSPKSVSFDELKKIGLYLPRYL